jgi:hypothetical protein
MRNEIRLVDLGRGETQLAGAALGDRIYEETIKPALAGLTGESVLLLSFRHVAFVTGSVFKTTWLRLHPETGVEVPSMVAHLSDDVRMEFGIFLRGHRLPGLEAVDWSASGVTLATLHGLVEPSSLNALQALIANPGASAPELQSASKEQVSPTAWTNRLHELHKNGLAFRQKAGRAWRFFPAAQEVRCG